MQQEKKEYNTQYWNCRYVINYFDGTKFYNDGSKFYDIVIFKNQKEFKKYQTKLDKEGFVNTSSFTN